MPYRDVDNDDLDEREFSDLDDSNEDDATVPCPYCRKPVFEDAERCPHCAHYISREDAPTRRPVWLVIGAIICLVIVLSWILH